MGDVYIEHLVKKSPTTKDIAMRALIVAFFVFMCAIGFLVMVTITPIGLLLPLVAGFVMLYLLSFFSVEYEYTLTNGELDIDIIYDKRRRKRLLSAELKKFEIMCHVTDTAHEHTFTRAQVYKDYSSGIIGPNTYKFFYGDKGSLMAVAFEPSDEILNAAKVYMGSGKLKMLKEGAS